ncbi:MAG: hypothetical protein RhofKO_43750 [Rhodothermales bacterium]
MPYSISFDAARKRVSIRMTGHILGTDLHEMIQHVWAAPDYDPSYDGVLDLVDATISIAPREVYDLVHIVRDSENHLRGRFAFISSHPLATAMSMLYQYRSHAERQVAVFSTLAAAEAWLDQAAAA